MGEGVQPAVSDIWWQLIQIMTSGCSNLPLGAGLYNSPRIKKHITLPSLRCVDSCPLGMRWKPWMKTRPHWSQWQNSYWHEWGRLSPLFTWDNEEKNSVVDQEYYNGCNEAILKLHQLRIRLCLYTQVQISVIFASNIRVGFGHSILRQSNYIKLKGGLGSWPTLAEIKQLFHMPTPILR